MLGCATNRFTARNFTVPHLNCHSLIFDLLLQCLKAAESTIGSSNWTQTHFSKPYPKFDLLRKEEEKRLRNTKTIFDSSSAHSALTSARVRARCLGAAAAPCGATAQGNSFSSSEMFPLQW